ncbi:MAG: diguanylate cyclase [Proteobacteria bacterium]|nr:diguanylate cyclase [Pseudomonadota bacterium]
MNILIIDDSPEDREQLKFLLNLGGHFELFSVDSISKAFKLLGIDMRKDMVSQSYDLIIIDIFMEGGNGLLACEKIKSVSHLKDIPLIAVADTLSMESMLIAFEVGVSDYISKPLDNKIELIPRVNSALNLKKEMEVRKAREKDLKKMTTLLESSNSKLQGANRLLKELATIDSLTGVANRRYFQMHIRREFKVSLRNKASIAILLADIDYFKSFNDIYGHQRGDKCLKMFATALKNSLNRPADVIARYGGEEFIVLLPNTDQKGAEIIAQRMHYMVNEMKIKHSGSKVDSRITFSMGVSCLIPAKETTVEFLIANADKALYQAKNQGRNRYVVYQDENGAGV